MRFIAAFVLSVSLLSAAEPVVLPKPVTAGGPALAEALAKRRSTREYSAKELPAQELSNLLWAAYGVNRAETGGRTAPSAHGWIVVDVYVALKQGLYLYEAKGHRLVPVAEADAREIAGTQEFVAGAALNLVYVAQMGKMKTSAEDTEQDLLVWAGAEAGAISQNVSLYCAGHGLATVVRAGVQRPAFAALAKLPKDRRILLAQTVGYAK